MKTNKQSKKYKKDLVHFMHDSPLIGVELDLTRDKSKCRDLDK